MTTEDSLSNPNRRNLMKAVGGAVFTATTASGLLSASGSVVAAEALVDVRGIKVLAFDFQGSCLNYYDPIKEMGALINQKKGISLDWDAFTKGWVENFYKTFALHKDDYAPTPKLFREALDNLLNQLQLSTQFNSEERAEMCTVWDRMVPWSDTVEGLTRLKRKYALTTLSNSTMASVFQTIQKHALPFDQVLTGELVHAYKPDPRVYNLVPSLLGYQKEDVLFCATHFSDLKAAKNFGFKTAWWPRPLETGPGPIDVAPKPFVDIVAKDIVDLARLLGA